ncbi:MAG: UDP-N-acetylmuramate dehydrogenase [Lachnospiraceae bacterium]|nr:UDP-N-acetylmuramate dehydrogenase [Lachnospiraceae bacterium]
MDQGLRDELLKELSNATQAENITENEPLHRRTTFRIGGPAAFFVTPGNEEELRQILDICNRLHVKLFLIGNGSNLLAHDSGFDGVVVKLGSGFSTLSVKDEINEGTGLITAGAGAMLTQLSMFALKKGFTGLEFAHGIPGTVGGAVFMNAGAYGGEVSQTIVSVKAMRRDGTVVTYMPDELDLGYRHSRFSDSDDIILEASFRLKVWPRIQIRAMMEGYKKARMEKQPLDMPSAGSTFKRPVGAYAGALIESSGLKGFKIGQAAVSEKHAGFVVNLGNATAADVLSLIDHIRKCVEEKHHILLEPEIKLID